MATKSKAKAKPVTPSADLKQIVTSNLQGVFPYHTADETAELVNQGLVEINPAMTQTDGAGVQRFAVRATQKGIDSMNTPAQTQTIGAGDVATISAGQLAGNGGGEFQFEIETNIPVPVVTGRGRAGSVSYPFERLEIGQAFFIPKPAKNLASTVSGANARFSEPVPGQFRTVTVKGENGAPDTTKQVPVTRQLRKFIARSAEKNGVKGTRIWRVDPNAGQSQAG